MAYCETRVPEVLDENPRLPLGSAYGPLSGVLYFPYSRLRARFCDCSLSLDGTMDMTEVRFVQRVIFPCEPESPVLH